MNLRPYFVSLRFSQGRTNELKTLVTKHDFSNDHDIVRQVVSSWKCLPLLYLQGPQESGSKLTMFPYGLNISCSNNAKFLCLFYDELQCYCCCNCMCRTRWFVLVQQGASICGTPLERELLSRQQGHQESASFNSHPSKGMWDTPYTEYYFSACFSSCDLFWKAISE